MDPLNEAKHLELKLRSREKERKREKQRNNSEGGDAFSNGRSDLGRALLLKLRKVKKALEIWRALDDEPVNTNGHVKIYPYASINQGCAMGFTHGLRWGRQLGHRW